MNIPDLSQSIKRFDIKVFLENGGSSIEFYTCKDLQFVPQAGLIKFQNNQGREVVILNYGTVVVTEAASPVEE